MNIEILKKGKKCELKNLKNFIKNTKKLKTKKKLIKIENCENSILAISM